MPLIDWLDKYNINIKEIDDQHKRLAEIINKFYESLQANKSDKILNKFLDDLLAESVLHFTREETIMILYKYPGYDAVKEEHDILSNELTNIFRGKNENKEAKFTKIAFFLRDWLIDHIFKDDLKLGKYLKEKGVT